MSLVLMKPTIDLKKYDVDFEDTMNVIQFDELTNDYDEIIKSGFRLKGAKLVWGVTHDVLAFAPGEVTIWGGYSYHGKSLLLGQACIGFAAQGEKVCLASLEMPPIKTYDRLIRQASQNGSPSSKFNHYFSDWLRDKMLAYDYVGSVTPRKMLAIIRYVKDVHKVKHFVIDNLMKVCRGEDDYNGQKNFVDDLQTLARQLNIHIHLVAHLRKGSASDHELPSMDMVKGSSAMTSSVEQVLLVHRNMRKGEKIAKALASGNTVEADQLRTLPDAHLIMAKNRNGNGDGAIPLWFDPKSMQYRAYQQFKTIDLMEWAAK